MAVFAGCSTSVKEVPSIPARNRNFQFEQNYSDANHIYYAPKGLFITNIRKEEFPENSWIRLTPGEQWPSYESRPTVLTGRIAERKKDYARIEILEFARTISSNYHLKAETYPPQMDIAQTLHSIGKLIAFPSGTNDGKSVLTTLSQDALVTGRELYGALDADGATAGRRFGSAVTALMSVPAEEIGHDAVRLKKVAGELPKNPIFVLLDAPLIPAYRVQLRIADISERNQITKKLQALLKQGIPGTEYIDISNEKPAIEVDDAIRQLGGIQTKTLEVVLTSHNRKPVIVDQAYRVEDSPYTVILDDSDPETTAVAMIARALEMLGYPASEAWLLEQAYHKADSIKRKAELVPALASAWHLLERDDWALELGLEQLTLADVASKSERQIALTAAAAAFSSCARSAEFQSIFEEVHANHASLPSAWQKTFAYAAIQSHANNSITSQQLPKWREYVMESRKDWNEFDAIFECLMAGDEEYCEESLDESTTELGRIWFNTQLTIAKGNISQILNYSAPLDSVGAPNLNKHLWLGLISAGLKGDAEFAALLSAAHYARMSQQTRTYIHLMEDHLLNSSVIKDFSPYSEAVSVWKALDRRYELASFSIIKAESSPVGESIELKTFAAELMLSTGNAELLGRIYKKLASDYDSLGQKEKSEYYRQRAIDFSNGTEYHPYGAQ
ncbi:MAG: hypothetical protein IJU23_03400 [Proteobacteria bacterium]|nr:hypothetical protein [Pseudomonadota bacterium]